MRHRFIHKTATRLMILLLTISSLALTSFISVQAACRYDWASAQAVRPLAARWRGGPIDPVALETFTDQLITRQLDEYHIAGAVVSIVQGGKIALAKGYGYGDVERQTPVTPDHTIFRIGSTSKLLTWTAVMQLVEQGKIDIDADVNTYLPDFKIPDTFPEPVTMRHLLSHTAGFEERTTGTESHRREEIISLHDYLARYMPDRVRRPGELITYSNYGASLAGYIVEAVSGMPFHQYVETHLFAPLSMSHSTFGQPLSAALAGQLAASYSYNGRFVPGAFEYVNQTPAGAMSSTAHDMANFVIVHLGDGTFEDTQVLKPETVRQMHSHLFSNDERLDGMAYGFLEWTYNGRRVLWHNGDIGNWHSALAIIPQENVGFFVDYNSNEGFAAVAGFYYAFMDAFFPTQVTGDPAPTDSSTADVGALAGEYRRTRSVYNHVDRIIHFPGQGNVSVTVNPDRTLSISGQPLYEKASLVYTTPDATDTVVFRLNDRTKVPYIFINNNQLFAYERLAWYETSTFNLVAFGACYVLLLSTLLAGLVAIFRRSKSTSPDSRLPRIARLWALGLSIVFLLVPVAINRFLTHDYKSPFPVYMVIVLAAVLAASVLVVGPVVFTGVAWARRFWGLAGRIHYSLVTVGLLGVVWLMYYWRLLGFRY